MQTIAETIAEVVRQQFDVELQPIVTRPEAQFGDASTNVAMQLAGRLGKNPREIAEQIARGLRETGLFHAVDVAGPGFINITLTDAALYEAATAELPKPLSGQKVLVEYSDPNPFKPLHAGHLYTTLVGDTIARLIEHAGAETIRINYGGDVGLHVARSMWAIITWLGGELPEKLADVPEADRAVWMGERYAEGTTADEDDPVAHEAIVAYNKRVYRLHTDNDHESAFAVIYWTCRQWSYEYFPELYRQLETVPFTRFIPESEVTPLGLETVQAHTGDVYQKSADSDAIIFPGETYGLHTRVFINSEGLPTYEAKDVGLSLTKWRDYQFDQSIIITANEQQQYMQVVLKSTEQFAPELVERTTHLTHGVVKLAGGVKMSSRRGNVLLALDILAAARDAATASGKNADESVVLAAVKYAFARARLGGDIVYDPAESVALDGNSGPYLQYAHARACSILSKAGGQMEEERKKRKDELQPEERLLLRKITEYNDVVEKATSELMPHHVCTYLYELAQEFNRFYEKNRVIGDDRQAVRVHLVSLYRDRLANGLELLGITAPQQM